MIYYSEQITYLQIIKFLKLVLRVCNSNALSKHMQFTAHPSFKICLEGSDTLFRIWEEATVHEAVQHAELLSLIYLAIFLHDTNGWLVFTEIG